MQSFSKTDTANVIIHESASNADKDSAVLISICMADTEPYRTFYKLL